ncbi:MAG: glycosyltransferase, partial [Acidobacteria bacterium]|nr:glycosyltransferase [Acidobacteriota bacterium]
MPMKISIVVCTYNYAHFLRDALQAAAAQTFRDFELLVVDDASTDNTEEVVHQFSSRLARCIYLRKPHTGLP